jgi:hypothetical protein
MLLGTGVALDYNGHVFDKQRLELALNRRGGFVGRPASAPRRLSEVELILEWLVWLPLELSLCEGVESANFILRLSRLEDFTDPRGQERFDAIQIVAYRPLIAAAPYYQLVYAPSDGPRIEITGLATFDFGDLGLWLQVVPNRHSAEAMAELPKASHWRQVGLGIRVRVRPNHPWARAHCP